MRNEVLFIALHLQLRVIGDEQGIFMYKRFKLRNQENIKGVSFRQEKLMLKTF